MKYESKLAMRDPHSLLRTVNKSLWSFLDNPDIQQAFKITACDWDDTLNTSHWKTKTPSDGFVDASMDLVFYINT